MQHKNRHWPHMTCEELKISDERKELFVILNKELFSGKENGGQN